MSEVAPPSGIMTATRQPTLWSFAEGESLVCLRCGFAVRHSPLGCKNPCGNCGFIYPLGDCSD